MERGVKRPDGVSAVLTSAAASCLIAPEVAQRTQSCGIFEFLFDALLCGGADRDCELPCECGYDLRQHLRCLSALA